MIMILLTYIYMHLYVFNHIVIDSSVSYHARKELKIEVEEASNYHYHRTKPVDEPYY